MWSHCGLYCSRAHRPTCKLPWCVFDDGDIMQHRLFCGYCSLELYLLAHKWAAVKLQLLFEIISSTSIVTKLNPLLIDLKLLMIRYNNFNREKAWKISQKSDQFSKKVISLARLINLSHWRGSMNTRYNGKSRYLSETHQTLIRIVRHLVQPQLVSE